MEKDMIITLEDNSEYALLDDTIVEGTKYFFAVKLDSNENPTKEFEIFEEIKDGEDVFMDIVDDEEIKKALTLDFTSNYLDEVTDMMADQEIGE